MFSLSLRRDLPLLCFGKAANCGAGSGRGGMWSGLAGGICRRASGSCRSHYQVSCSIPAPFALWDALAVLPWDAWGSGLPGWMISPFVSELCQNQPSTSAAFQAAWPPLASAPGAHAGGKNPSPSYHHGRNSYAATCQCSSCTRGLSPLPQSHGTLSQPLVCLGKSQVPAVASHP